VVLLLDVVVLML
jgi:hypothetical protein